MGILIYYIKYRALRIALRDLRVKQQTRQKILKSAGAGGAQHAGSNGGGAITILRTSHLVEDEGAGCHTTTEPQECISTHREVCSRSGSSC